MNHEVKRDYGEEQGEEIKQGDGGSEQTGGNEHEESLKVGGWQEGSSAGCGQAGLFPGRCRGPCVDRHQAGLQEFLAC
jgi:hypothetical protein